MTEDDDDFAAYLVMLERAILIAAEAFHSDDVEYGMRVIWLIEGRIRAAMAAADEAGQRRLH